MNLLFWGLTVGLLGKVLLASAVIIAHHGLVMERRVDEVVIKGFRLELVLTILGLALIIAGYFMEVYFYGFTTTLLTCSGAECAASVGAFIVPG